MDHHMQNILLDTITSSTRHNHYAKRNSDSACLNNNLQNSNDIKYIRSPTSLLETPEFIHQSNCKLQNSKKKSTAPISIVKELIVPIRSDHSTNHKTSFQMTDSIFDDFENYFEVRYDGNNDQFTLNHNGFLDSPEKVKKALAQYFKSSQKKDKVTSININYDQKISNLERIASSINNTSPKFMAQVKYEPIRTDRLNPELLKNRNFNTNRFRFNSTSYEGSKRCISNKATDIEIAQPISLKATKKVFGPHDENFQTTVGNKKSYLKENLCIFNKKRHKLKMTFQLQNLKTEPNKTFSICATSTSIPTQQNSNGFDISNFNDPYIQSYNIPTLPKVTPKVNSTKVDALLRAISRDKKDPYSSRKFIDIENKENIKHFSTEMFKEFEIKENNKPYLPNVKLFESNSIIFYYLK